MTAMNRISMARWTALGLALFATLASAHDAATMASMTAPHGGQLRMTGPYHYELVLVKTSMRVKENPVLVYVTDHAGQKIDTAGASGSATLTAGQLKASATLRGDGDNRMKGFAKYASTPDMQVLVSITLPGKQPEQAAFTPLASASDGPKQRKP